MKASATARCVANATLQARRVHSGTYIYVQIPGSLGALGPCFPGTHESASRSVTVDKLSLQPPPTSSCQTRRYFAAQTDHFSTNAVETDGTTSAADKSRTRQGRPKPNRLEADTHLVLREIPPGKMTSGDRSLAHRTMVAWQKRRTAKGAERVERLLERLVEEEEAGNHRVANVTAQTYNIAIDSWPKSGAEDCGQRAESILHRMEERYQRRQERERQGGAAATDFTPARPDTITYNTTLHALSQSPDRDAPARVEELVRRMEDLSNDPRSNVHPDNLTYNALINAYANRKGEYGTGQKAEDVLLRMSEINKDGVAGVNPNTRSFNIVIKAWLNSGDGDLESAKRAEQLLRLMAKLQHDGHDYVRPDAISFSTCMRAYAKVEHGGDESIERVEGLLALLEETGASTGEDMTQCFDAAITVIGRSGVNDAGERAMRIIDRMTLLHDTGAMNVRPSSNTQAQVMYAMTRGIGDSAKSAEHFFSKMIEEATCSSEGGGVGEGGTSSMLKPNAASFRTLMKVILEADEDGAVRRVDALLSMLEQASQEHPSLAPDTAIYNMVIDAYSKSKERGAAANAFGILRRMETSFASGNRKARPVGFAYNSVLGQLKRCRENGAEAMAYEGLIMMERQSKEGNSAVIPDTISFNVVIGMQAKLGTTEGAERALVLLRRQEALTKGGLTAAQPDCISYASVINAYTKIGHPRVATIALDLLKKAKQSANESGLVGVDTVLYKSVLGALNKSGKLHSARKAYDILMEMKALSNEGGEAVDSVCVNMVIGSFAASGRGTKTASLCQEVLVKLIGQSMDGSLASFPDRIGFNSVLHAWVKSNDPAAIKHAENLLRLMSELKKQGGANLEPDARTISCVVQILSKNREIKDSALRAQDFFDMLDKESDAKPKADKVLFDHLLNVWAKSNEPDKHHRTSAILRMMNDRYKEGSLKVKPNLVSFNIVLNSCAYASGEDGEDALQIAIETYEQIQNSALKPDGVTYGTMIKAIYNLSKDADYQQKLVGKILDQCKSDGQVGKLVITSLPETRRWELLGVDEADGLPSQWTRNVK